MLCKKLFFTQNQKKKYLWGGAVIDMTETHYVKLLLESLPSLGATYTKGLHFILGFLMPLSHPKYNSMSGFCLTSKQKLSEC